jgi:hypothetical protein
MKSKIILLYLRKPMDFHQFADAVRNPGLYWPLLNEPPPR